jgi:myo-inositol-1(or 4)-monophosphatase
MHQLDHLADVARSAVRIGTELIKTTRPHTVTEKTDRDTFTEVDVQIEREVRAYLAEVTPEIGFVGEEEGRSEESANSPYVWGLDPIDGTANFVHDVPLCGCSLALLQGDHTVIGVISLPYLDLHYSAVLGGGAFVNGKKLQASKTTELSKSIVAIGDYAVGEHAVDKNRQRLALTAKLAAEVERIRMFGSAAHDLAWLAEGRIDGAIVLSNNPLDLAAGILIAREAGAVVMDSSGKEHSSEAKHTIAATSAIAAELLSLVQSAL